MFRPINNIIIPIFLLMSTTLSAGPFSLTDLMVAISGVRQPITNPDQRLIDLFTPRTAQSTVPSFTRTHARTRLGVIQAAATARTQREQEAARALEQLQQLQIGGEELGESCCPKRYDYYAI